jgi:hypothetical protein
MKKSLKLELVRKDGLIWKPFLDWLSPNYIRNLLLLKIKVDLS